MRFVHRLHRTGADQAGHNRRQTPLQCRALGLEQGGDEERVILKLDGTHCTGFVVPGGLQRLSHQRLDEGIDETVAAQVLLADLTYTVELGNAS